MPVVHREAGLRFVIYVDDHLPPHVHVKGDCHVKLEISTARLLGASSAPAATVRRAQRIAAEQRILLQAAWDDIHD